MSLSGTLRYKCAALGCPNAFYTDIFDNNYRNKKFFRFPDDVDRRIKWFNIMGLPFTNKRKYLCENHFEDKCFTDTVRSRLTKFALPSKTPNITTVSNIVLNSSNTEHSYAFIEPLQSNMPSTSGNNLGEKSSFITKNTDTELPQKLLSPSIGGSHTPLNSSQLTPKKHNSILSEIKESRVLNLTPKKKKLYNINVRQRRMISKLKYSLTQSKHKLKEAFRLSNSDIFVNLEKKWILLQYHFLGAQFKIQPKKGLPGHCKIRF